MPGDAALLERLEHPALVAAQVDDDHRGAGRGEGQLAPDRDLAAVHRRHAGAQRPEVGGELAGDAALGVAGETSTSRSRVGEQGDDGVERRRVDGVERRLHVRQLGGAVAGDRLVAAELADPLGGRAQLAGEVALDRRLQGAEPVEAELGGEPHDGGGAGGGRLGEVGDGAEADELRPRQDDLGDTPLGRRQLRAGVPDALLDLHLRHGRTVVEGVRAAPGLRRYVPSDPPSGATSCGGAMLAVQLPPPPARSFASDNFAGAHPAVLEAVARANDGHAPAYGDDPWTAACEAAFRDLFGDVTTLLTFNGTGANVLALASLLGPAEAVVCSDVVAHRGRRDRRAGAHPRRQADRPAERRRQADARPTSTSVAHLIGSPHHAQPGVVSITQSTELGTLYTADEVAAICDVAHRLGMRVHMDGARIANAIAALGGGVATLRALTVDAGVDVADVRRHQERPARRARRSSTSDPSWPRRAVYLRKQVTQLPSKMRFVAAQFLALLEDDRWLDLAGHANAMAARLHEAVAGDRRRRRSDRRRP